MNGDDKKQLILGIGTGRCGTSSLAILLDDQPGFDVSHEFRYPKRKGRSYRRITYKGKGALLPWDVRQGAQQFSKVRDELESRTVPFFGDVAFYHLPYIQTHYAQTFDDIKVISIQRDREETINSYDNWVGRHNHWFEHDGSRWNHDPCWDRCFPNFNEANNRKQAIGMYWDHYYEQVNELTTHFDVFKMRTRDLNNEKRINELLVDFLGIDDPVCRVGIKANAS